MILDTMGNLRRSHYAGELRQNHLEETVILMGWVQTKRSFGAITFIDLRDTAGISQIVFDEQTPRTVFEKATTLASEDVIAIQGKVRERSAVNPEIPTGQVEVLATDLRILSKANTPPIYIRDQDDVSEDLRLKHRFLDLRKPEMQTNLLTRAKITQVTRRFFEAQRFVDIETPVLSKATPEGARDYLVPSRVHAGNFYALPQSPQLFKQLLMVAGFDRYYQITKAFRDEDLRANRQPEFTQIDVEMSFVDMEDVIAINERYIQTLFKEVINQDIALPLPRMTYQEAIERYGVDKPDTRFGMEIVDVSEILKDSEFRVFSANVKPGSSVRFINVKNASDQFTNRQTAELEAFVQEHGAMGIVHIHVEADGNIRTPIARFLTDEEKDGLLEATNAEENDLLLAVAAPNEIVFEALGSLRVHLANKLYLIDNHQLDIRWITEFPLVEYDAESERYVAVHHPFTAPMDEDLERLETDIASVRSKAYDLVINGEEVGGGSIRIANLELQKQMFNLLGINAAEQEEKFGFLLEAFKYGVPPHGGIAYGLDRLVMEFTKAKNIRDVIAFPKTQTATDLLTGAPTSIDEATLAEIHISMDDKLKNSD